MGSTSICGEETFERTTSTVELTQEVDQGTSHLEEILNFLKMNPPEDGRLQRSWATADNPFWVLQMYDTEHVEAFWDGHTVSKVLPQGTPMHLQLPALYPGLHGPAPPQLLRPAYTPEEVHVYSQTYEALNLTRRLGEDFMRSNLGLLTRTFLYYPVPMRFLEFNWQQLPSGQMIQGVILPKIISGDFFQHGVGMINFHMNMRSCVCFTSWGMWMNLQEHLQQGHGSQLPDYLNDVMCYVAIRLETSRLEAGILHDTFRFWNRRYCDFMLNSTRNYELSELELSTSRVYFLGRMKSSFISTLLFYQVPQNSSLHPATGHCRFFHAFLQSRPRELLGSDHDWTVPAEVVINALHFRARL